MSVRRPQPRDLDRAVIETRLAGLYGPDPRIGWLPDRPDAAEAHVRLDGRCDVVVGYTGSRFGEVDAFVRRCTAHAAELGHADHRAAWQRWLAVAGNDVMDAGAQLAADRGLLQVYVRGHHDPATVERAFAAVGCTANPRLVANALALFGVATVEMIGLELADDHVGAAIYLAVRSQGNDEHVRGLGDAIRFLLSAVQPPGDAAARWSEVSRMLLATATEEYVYISLEPTAALRWVKVDVGARPLARADAVARALGHDPEPMIAKALAHDMTSLSHVGLRFTSTSSALSIYHSLV